MRLHGSGHIPQRGECGLRTIFADEAAAGYTTSDCLKDCSYEQAVAERRARVRELRQRLQQEQAARHALEREASGALGEARLAAELRTRRAAPPAAGRPSATRRREGGLPFGAFGPNRRKPLPFGWLETRGPEGEPLYVHMESGLRSRVRPLMRFDGM
jgi:hypothetical protein